MEPLLPVSNRGWRSSPWALACMPLLTFVWLLAAVDSAVLVTVLPLDAQRFKGTATASYWTAISYLLASAITQPFIATTSDIWGTHTKMLWLSVAAFGAGSIICALSQSPALLLAGLTLQGLGSGGMISLVQVISARLLLSRPHPGGHCIVSASWAIGNVAGPFLASTLTSTSTFCRLALFNTPLCGLALALIPWVIPSCGPSTQCSRLRIDWEGMVLFLSSMSSLALGISWSGVTFAWTSRCTFITIAIGISGILLFIIWERSVARFPMFEAGLFKRTPQIAAYFYCCFQGTIFSCLLYYIPFYFTSVQRRTPTQSTLCTLSFSCSLLLGKVASQVIIRYQPHKEVLKVGWILTILGLGFLLLLETDTGLPRQISILFVLGIGTGSLLSAIGFLVRATFKVCSSSSGAVMCCFFQSFGMSLGVVVGGNIFRNSMAHFLAKHGVSTSIAQDPESFVEELHLIDATDLALQAILQAYIKGFHGVFLMLLGLSILGFALSMYVWSSTVHLLQ